jgi:queuine tRNA-ribosyltransferase
MLFPIVQGSTFADLREKSAAYIAAKDAPGNAIGGLAVGEPAEEMYRMIELVNTILPKDKPRYLMGVGTPVNILESIALGIDMFDCVMPTRNGRNGMIFTRNGIMNMRNQKWQQDHGLLDPGGPSFVDESYSRAFVRHLFVSGEILGPMIASQHNLAFYLWLVREARSHILHGDFSAWMQAIKPQLAQRL